MCHAAQGKNGHSGGKAYLSKLLAGILHLPLGRTATVPLKFTLTTFQGSTSQQNPQYFIFLFQKEEGLGYLHLFSTI